MKKLWLIAILALGAAFSANAESMPEDKSNGCGVGWYVMQDKSLLGTSVRNITDNALGVQAFGMTTGTSNCAKHDIVKVEKEQIYYTEMNMESLVAEMAQGQGQYLNEYARVLGCQDVEGFSKMTQESFLKISPSSETSAVEMFKNIKEQIKVQSLNCAV